MEQQQKVFCWSGKTMKDNWITASINIDKIQDYIETYEGTKFVRLNINVADKPDKFGKNVSLTVNTWKPDNA